MSLRGEDTSDWLESCEAELVREHWAEEGRRAAAMYRHPICPCGAVATCFGSYEGQRHEYGCDVCCGHGNEDGKCWPAADPTPGYVPAVRRVEAWIGSNETLRARKVAAYRDAARSRMWGASSLDRLTHRCDVLENDEDSEDPDRYWGRVRDRFASILSAQDRKHGGRR